MNEWEYGVASSCNKIHNHRNKSKEIGLGAKDQRREKLYQQRLREGTVNEQNSAQNCLRVKVKRSYDLHT